MCYKWFCDEDLDSKGNDQDQDKKVEFLAIDILIEDY
jgi:hypothetical protein